MTFRTLGLALATASLAFSAPALAKLSPQEERIVAAVDKGHDRWIGVLEAITLQNSGSRNIAGVKKVGEMVTPELERLGFKVEWVDQSAAKRSGHLIATRTGRPGSTKMLLIGHLDTVFEPDSPFQAVRRLNETTMEGPGVEDNKGGVVTMFAALEAMQAAGTLSAATITVVLTGDEEDAGDPIDVARADLVKWGQWADVALDFEGLSQIDGKDMGSIARRSSYSWQINATGKEGHSQGIFSASAGHGAIYELARIIDQFRKELPEDKLTFNVGLIAGGSVAALDADLVRAQAAGKTNIIPAVAVARGDFRTLSDEQSDRIKAKMQAIVAQHLSGTGAEIVFEQGYPPMAPTEGNRGLLRRLNLVNADLGLEQMAELDPLKRGAGDISFVARYVDGLVGMGPAGDGAHAPGETVDLPSIKRQAKRSAILMTRLSMEKR
ncbi:M20/M25/M40 family metallo-hydrolase [Blastomonas aquatica]|uniref:Peptidase M20 n=1 Tax=Blastomonas aquatica TaxID=1510276 RepID=A0ABQ1JUB6_9SPHN|nr:M20/M25/M40 family metallo-hydrolase [Blastomonas aquatica]GGB75147.1 peptidase M20 [Blastomonas aquatica]